MNAAGTIYLAIGIDGFLALVTTGVVKQLDVFEGQSHAHIRE
jgi:hypothetical protein